MLGSGFLGLAIERFAYRPLRKRNAPALIALISAIYNETGSALWVSAAIVPEESRREIGPLIARYSGIFFGMLTVVNFAHGAFYMVGAYVGVYILTLGGDFWICLIAVPALVLAMPLLIAVALLIKLDGAADFPEAVTALHSSATNPGRPLTWISGWAEFQAWMTFSMALTSPSPPQQ